MSSELLKTASQQPKPRNGTVGAENEVRLRLARAMTLSNKTRKQIAEEISEKLGRTVSRSMLADFTRKIGERRFIRFPLAWVPSFCAVLGDKTLARFALDVEDKRLLQFGERAEGAQAACDALREELAALIGQERAKSKKLLRLSATFRRAAKGKAKGSRKPRRR